MLSMQVLKMLFSSLDAEDQDAVKGSPLCFLEIKKKKQI